MRVKGLQTRVCIKYCYKVSLYGMGERVYRILVVPRNEISIPGIDKTHTFDPRHANNRGLFTWQFPPSTRSAVRNLI